MNTADVCRLQKGLRQYSYRQFYNIMQKFDFPKKFINLIEICMEGAKYQVRVNSIDSEAFSVETRLKQGDTLSPSLFDIAFLKQDGTQFMI